MYWRKNVSSANPVKLGQGSRPSVLGEVKRAFSPNLAALPRMKFLMMSVELSLRPRLLMVSNSLNASLASLTSSLMMTA